jgi:uncharacterized protein (TIGR03435 family)
VALACLGQEFEAVSIKSNKSMSGSSQSNTSQGMFRGTNLSLKNLILRGFGIRSYQLEGPDWLDSERFDITARFPEMPKEGAKYVAAYQALMQKMLADRFKLAVHRDRKSMAVYGLVVGKGGIKFKEVPPGRSNSSSNNTHYVGTSISMDTFVTFLSGQMDLPVLDMTGLTGTYDVKLDWINQQQADTEPAAGQSIQDALQDQLGLKFERRKAPVDIVIVDHAEKVPTEN